jgi:predicted O-methyltransferase YrrM
MAVLPQALRRAVPERVRDDVRLRALAVGAGLIPPRTLHSDAERELLQELARDATRVVEIGVYEGASAAALCAAMRPDAELHLIDPFGHHPTALPAGWGAIEQASRRVVARAAQRHDGPRVIWHVERSEDTGRRWSAPVDVVFIDGDHAEEATRTDWELFSGHVVPGGHVLFHDATGLHALPGPAAVVAEVCDQADWSIAAEVDRTVAVRKNIR